MSAKIMLIVKDSSYLNKQYSVSVWDKMLHPIKSEKAMRAKYQLLAAVDEEEPQLFEASKTAYEFTVDAGHHTLTVMDPQKDTRQKNFKAVGGMTGAMFGFAQGNMASTLIGASSGSDLASDLVNAGASCMEFDLQEGDVIKIQCHAGIGGKVSMKIV